MQGVVARQVMLEADLRRQLAACLTLLREAPYSDRVTLPREDAAGIIDSFFAERSIGALSVGPADFRASLDLAVAAAGARA